jgi:heat-inducible transcriptional repressor
MDLSDRQIQILRAIVEEYSQTAQAVGSEKLDRKYGLGVSPATIRNEMVTLAEMGYLSQPHTSSGRTPTPKAIKFYISELMRERDISVAEEVAVKEQMWDYRAQLDNLLRQATRVLSEKTGMLGVAATDDQRVYHSGYAHILDIPEFFDIDVTKGVLNLIDEVNELWGILEAQPASEESVRILIGEDLGAASFTPVGMVCAPFHAGGHNGSLGVIGPSRLNYPYVIPLVRYLGRLVNEMGE